MHKSAIEATDWHRIGKVNFAKFSPPTLANNRAYVPTYDGELVVFGLG